MLTKKLSELQEIIKTGEAKTAAQAGIIVRAIVDKKPDEFLKTQNLHKFLYIYKQYAQKTLSQLKAYLENFNDISAIDIIVILHLIQNFKKQSKIAWPQQKIIKQHTHLKYNKKDIEFFIEMNEGKPSSPPPEFISEYIEKRRIMPANTPIPGPWENWRSQYAVEIMDCMSPWNPTQHVDVMSAAQVVKTALMENVIGYYMGANPAPILFMSGTDMLLNKWASKRLEPLIDSLNLREKLHAPNESEKSRTTGDKAKQKLFAGGFLEMASAQSPAAMRSDSVRILLLDEVDAAPLLLNTGEGHWDRVAEARTKAWGNRRKILACSTPTEFQSSTIYRRFLLGDRCEYYVPCPCCKKFILLQRGDKDGSYGIRAELKDGKLDFVYYICQECGEAIFEHQKNNMIRGGKWIPQAKPERLRRSFHLNSLLSPVGAYSWIDYYQDFLNTEREPEAMREFINLCDGLPYQVSGTRPKIERVLENRGTYRISTVPENVLFLTMGIDVQRGSSTDLENPPRLEAQILGHGLGYRTWSIDYKTFKGSISDPNDGAWKELSDWAKKSCLEYKREIDGFLFPISLIFIDSGDGESTSTVYDFCKEWVNTFPIKGQRVITRQKNEKPDEMTESVYIRYRHNKQSEGNILYTISTVYYKNKIYDRLKIKRSPDGQQRPGFIDFPVDYKENYFNQLTSEEKMSDGSFDSKGRRNEALDTFVYALCAGDVFLDSELENYKLWAKENGYSKSEIMKINHRTVLDQMIESTKVRK